MLIKNLFFPENTVPQLPVGAGRGQMCVFRVVMGFEAVQSGVLLLSPPGASPPCQMTSRPLPMVRGVAPADLGTSPGRYSPGPLCPAQALSSARRTPPCPCVPTPPSLGYHFGRVTSSGRLSLTATSHVTPIVPSLFCFVCAPSHYLK